MSGQRLLIVNADDLGLSLEVNAGIFAAHERGIVTSASLMVRHASAAWGAAQDARQHPALSLGLHVDLGEWAYQAGQWVSVYDVADLNDSVSVRRAIYQQLDVFRHLVGQEPMHLDSHQHVHREQPMRRIMLELAFELNVPLRHFSPHIRYCGAFYGQTATGTPLHESISLSALLGLLADLPEGISELACHPGMGSPLNTMYRAERCLELDVLCRSEVREALAAEDIRLMSFTDLCTHRVVVCDRTP